MFRKFVAVFMSLFILCSPVFGGYVEDNTQSPAVASIGGEWALIGMLGEGTASEAVKTAYLNNLRSTLEEKSGVLSTRRYTEYSRVVVALNLLGEDACNFAGYDLVTPLLDIENVGKQGINGTIFALIALAGGDYGSVDYRNTLLNTILQAQTSQGYFEYGGKPNADITAMALCAFAPYMDNQQVSSAADKAVNALATMVNEDGLILTDDIYSSETISQVIIGLSAVGVDAEKDSRFVKNGRGLVTTLEDFAADGGYAHIMGEGVNPMASEQGLCAKAAYTLYKEGNQPLYYPVEEKLSPATVMDRLMGVICYEK